MAADTTNVGLIATLGGVVTVVIAVLGFWTKYVIDRIAGAKEIAVKADAKADAALQEAAEAKQETRDAREANEEMYRTLHDEIVRSNRETGESNSAMRAKINDVELFMRDNFARKDDLSAAVMKIEAGQIRTDTKIDQLRDLIKNGS